MEKIIATVGPSLLNRIPINQVRSENIIYRINGAHGTIGEIEQTINEIKRQIPNAKILMDLPGNKVRTFNLLNNGVTLNKDKVFDLNFDQTNYPKFHEHLNEGDIVWANDSTFKFIVSSIDLEKKKISFLSKSNGRLLLSLIHI